MTTGNMFVTSRGMTQMEVMKIGVMVYGTLRSWLCPRFMSIWSYHHGHVLLTQWIHLPEYVAKRTNI